MSTLLKQGPKRTVTLESCADGRRVVKRFHSPGPVDGLKDGLRAWREYRALAWLRRRGLPVPAPLAVRRRQGHWELVQEWVDDAVPLAGILEGTHPWPTSRGRVARALGTLIAELVLAKVHHPDLHAGNVLVDSSGDVHMVDLARVRRSFSGTDRGILLELAAGVREQTSPNFRARVLRAYRRRLPHPGPIGSMDSFEEEVRDLRRQAVIGRAARFRRVSGAMRTLTHESAEGFLRRELEQEPGILEAEAGVLPSPWDSQREVLVIDDRGDPALQQRWDRAALLESHGLSAERALALVSNPARRMLFDRPRGAQALEECRKHWTPEERIQGAGEAGKLSGSLQDRGLEEVEPRGSGVLAAAPRNLLLDVGNLRPAQAPNPAAALDRWTATLGSVSPQEVDAFIDAFVSAQRGTAAERARLRGEFLRTARAKA